MKKLGLLSLYYSPEIGNVSYIRSWVHEKLGEFKHHREGDEKVVASFFYAMEYLAC